MSTSRHRNRLADEPSLYLRQHATNPVDWYPWGPEALERARLENEAIARLMNDLFVCIKVDREERPDVDAVYMKALQAMTGRGGWPMTVFLTPETRPYYAGTYFPPEDRQGMPGFARVLVGAAEAWRDRREDVETSAARVVEFLGRGRQATGSLPALDEEKALAAAAVLEAQMDAHYGGFGDQPKFPATSCLSYLLGVNRAHPGARRQELLRTALDAMAAGGIRDHLGGGFHRYSVDRQWLVPHFEKMLYDQAQMVALYVEAWRALGEPGYRDVALEVLDYVAREMTDASGGFYSAQDADSEGVEGRYFLWSASEIRRALSREQAEAFEAIYGVTESGNFEGACILHLAMTTERAARLLDCSSEELGLRLATGRRALLELRERRVRPATDQKILADWNGLMIGAAAAAGHAFGRDDIVAMAERAVDFAERKLWSQERLFHVWTGSEARVPAFLDDYAFLGRGALETFHATGRTRYLKFARRLADRILEAFVDQDGGGFYFSSVDGEPMLARTSELHDGAVPSGNAVAVELLLRLHCVTGEQRYAEAGRGAMAALLPEALAGVHGGAHLLTIAHRVSLGLVVAVAVAGEDVVGLRDLERRVLSLHAPELALLAPADDEDLRPPVAEGKRAVDGRATLYLCRDNTCEPPIVDRDLIEERLR
jgi:uncharacterized protein YyaL (SSP411 family)